MNKILIVLSIVLLTAVSASAFTKGLSGGAKKDGAVSITMDDAVASQSNLVKAYANGVKFNLQTQGIMAEALGLKEDAAQLQTAANSIQDGNSKGIDAARAETQSVSANVEKKMAEGGELSADARIKVGESLITLTQCILSYKDAVSMSKTSLDMAQTVIKDAPMLQKASAKSTLEPVLTIAPKMPGDLVSVTTTAKKYIEFAKSAGIEAPADLNKALGDL
jgi:hypothetical protein